MTLDQYFKHLMKYKDKRFAQDPRFRFFALNTIMRHGMLQKSGPYRRNADEYSYEFSHEFAYAFSCENDYPFHLTFHMKMHMKKLMEE